MKRDIDLIRQLAIRIEDTTESISTRDISVNSFTPEVIYYHCALMRDAELIEVFGVNRDSEMMIKQLTWKGHDFLDAARDEKLWTRVRKSIKERVTSVTFDGLMSLLKFGAQRVLTEGWDILQ